MNKTILFDFRVDKENNKINVERSFDAPLELVWAAWTEAENLDQWWAPKPYRAETKTLKFNEGGYWLYAMIGPGNDVQWCRADYERIIPKTTLSWRDAFCDEHGNIRRDFPRSHWVNEFKEDSDSTVINITISYDALSDLEKIIDLGFKEGFTAGLDNLDQYLSTQFRLRKEYKTNRKERVTTYLNFPGKTEEAFNFYKKVFNGKFPEGGLRRFGDVAMPDGAPPMSDADKKLIIHAELTIMGGHVLMATDAPESMGFKMEHGNNMHINIEPSTRKETERLYKELSSGGEISMPLQEMFWGAYFASFKDKYGINWMINYQNE